MAENKNNQEITVNGGMNGARNGAQIDPMNGAEDDIVTTSSPPTAPLKHKPVSSASVKFENIPAELKKKSSFCVWRREESKDGKGKMGSSQNFV
ncbi:MAG: hypothetical protein IKR36_06325 [Clostridia bacterium]|nr:hypothetical protein [Clostridia bacterium]